MRRGAWVPHLHLAFFAPFALFCDFCVRLSAFVQRAYRAWNGAPLSFEPALTPFFANQPWFISST